MDNDIDNNNAQHYPVTLVYDGRDKSTRELQWGGPASTALIYSNGAALSLAILHY